jgi:hypothetical protein
MILEAKYFNRVLYGMKEKSIESLLEGIEVTEECMHRDGLRG